MNATDNQLMLVTGATGETGRRVVARLRAKGQRVRVLARDASRARGLLGTDVSVHTGDVRDPASLVGIGRDVAGCISAIGTRTYFGRNGGAAVDAVGTHNLVAALAAEGRPHFVLLSAFGLDRRSLFLSVFSAALGNYFLHKAVAEEAARNSNLPWTLVRPVELRNRAPKSGPLLAQHEPLSLLRAVSRDLVADVLVHCVCNPLARDRTFELCEGSEAPLDVQLRALVGEADRRAPSRSPLLPCWHRPTTRSS